jgi:DNA-binding response OmpR family regulator
MEVLLVDDNKEITDMISFFLNNQGISCHVLKDAKDALYKIKTKNIIRYY